MAQSVEHVIGNDEVISSILITSSIEKQPKRVAFFDSFYKKTGKQPLLLACLFLFFLKKLLTKVKVFDIIYKSQVLVWLSR